MEPQQLELLRQLWLHLREKLNNLQQAINEGFNSGDELVQTAVVVALYSQGVLETNHRILEPKIEDDYDYAIQRILNLTVEANKHADYVLENITRN